MEAREGTFEWACIQLKAGKKISRKSWSHSKWWVKADPDTSDGWQYFVYMNHTNGIVPWQPQQFDMSGTDFYIVEE